jgi:hypothetical protein
MAVIAVFGWLQMRTDRPLPWQKPSFVNVLRLDRAGPRRKLSAMTTAKKQPWISHDNSEHRQSAIAPRTAASGDATPSVL